jgi:hypothetical protein
MELYCRDDFGFDLRLKAMRNIYQSHILTDNLRRSRCAQVLKDKFRLRIRYECSVLRNCRVFYVIRLNAHYITIVPPHAAYQLAKDACQPSSTSRTCSLEDLPYSLQYK